MFDRVTTDCAGPLDCRMRAGEVVGLVGLRGAGHESIGRALFGLAPVTGGHIVLDGEAIAASSPREAIALGINLVCADRMTESIVPGLSIRENLFLNPVRRRAAISSRISCLVQSQTPRCSSVNASG